MNAMTKPLGGFRDLSTSEIALVSGGDGVIVVTGSRPTFTIQAGSDGGNFGLAGLGAFQHMDLSAIQSIDLEAIEALLAEFAEEVPEPTPEQMEVFTQKLAEALGAGFEDYVEKYGDFDINIPNGPTIKASALVKSLDALGKFTIVVEGVGLTIDALNGNPDLTAALGFFAGLAVTAGLSVAGAPVLVTLIASWAAAEGVEALAEAIQDGTLEELVDSFAEAVVESFDYTPIIDRWLTEQGLINPHQPGSPEWQFWYNILNPFSGFGPTPDFIEP